MATYKVIQDIEAEDKLLGPLTLRQFIYAGICALCLYLSFLVITKHAWFLVIIFGPVAIFTGFFAFPWKLNQPTEVWALAKIRFLFKPRRRVWDQSGMKELVTITAPKKVETNYTNNLSQTEVKSRLRALADTIDSRGWAVKNVNVNLSGLPAINNNADSDRLIDASALPQQPSALDVQAEDDMLDERTNPVAQQFDKMIQESSVARRQQIVQQISNDKPEPEPAAKRSNNKMRSLASTWFTGRHHEERPAEPVVDYGAPGSQASMPNDESVNPAEEAKLSKKLRTLRHKPDAMYSHLRTLSPISGKLKKQRSLRKKPAPVTQTPDPAILKLASNNDLNVATLARQANKKEPDTLQDEVVISLH